jgi:hypothetical protein
MTICKTCGGNVTWVMSDGRWSCFNHGTVVDHWDTCSKRKWEQVKATGIRFDEKMASGYTASVHGTKYERKSSGVIRGKNYKPTGFCLGCVPPWEACPIGCPDALPTP